jgi:hypothetical protein
VEGCKLGVADGMLVVGVMLGIADGAVEGS